MNFFVAKDSISWPFRSHEVAKLASLLSTFYKKRLLMLYRPSPQLYSAMKENPESVLF